MATEKKPNRITTDEEINKYYSGKQIKKKMNIFRLIIELLLVLGVIYGGYLLLTNNTDLGALMKKSTGTYQKTTVDMVYKDLSEDETNAVKKYENMYVELTGRFTKKKNNGFFMGNVSGKTVGNGVWCNVVDDMERQNIKTLNVGAKVTVKGKITKINSKGIDIDVTSFTVVRD